MVGYIKDAVKGSAIYFYYLTHPEDGIIKEIMNREFELYEYQAHDMCYQDIIQNNRMDIIYDIISNMSRLELQAVARVAIDENSRELIELLYQNNLNPWFYIACHSELFTYAYNKQGLEIIKVMKDVGFCVDSQTLFENFIRKGDIEAANYFIEVSTKPIDTLFKSALGHARKNIKFIVELFIDKIDIMSHGTLILKECRNTSVEDIKSFLDYGITIDSNEPLKFACLTKNLELVEFYLQYGLQVDSYILSLALLGDDEEGAYANKDLAKLFLKYNVDFSILTDDSIIDHAFLANLENNGLNKDILLPSICILQEN